MLSKKPGKAAKSTGARKQKYAANKDAVKREESVRREVRVRVVKEGAGAVFGRGAAKRIAERILAAEKADKVSGIRGEEIFRKRAGRVDEPAIEASLDFIGVLGREKRKKIAGLIGKISEVQEKQKIYLGSRVKNIISKEVRKGIADAENELKELYKELGFAKAGVFTTALNTFRNKIYRNLEKLEK